MMLDETKAFVRSELFGGKGSVSIWNLMGNRSAPPFSAVLWCRLEPHARVGEHRQAEDPEIVVGLGGTGRATVDGEEHRLGEGTLIHLPLGAVLSIENESAVEHLSYLIVKAAGVAHSG